MDENPTETTAASDATAHVGHGSTVEPSPPDAAIGRDYDPRSDVEEDIAVIADAHRQWDDLNTRSHNACRRALGEIFVRASITDEDPEKKSILVEKALADPRLRNSDKFNPNEKTAAELHLALLFGLKDEKSSKSNWKAALDAADKAYQAGDIKERSVEAFTAWFRPLGFTGARQYRDGGPGKRREAKMNAVEGIDGTAFPVPVELFEHQKEHHGLAVMVVRLPESGSDLPAEALGIVTDLAVVAAACVSLSKNHDRHNRVIAAECEGGPHGLRVPERYRWYTEGRTYWRDEDERADFEQELKSDREYARKKYGAARRSGRQPWETRKGLNAASGPLAEFVVDPGDVEPPAPEAVTLEVPPSPLPNPGEPVAAGEPEKAEEELDLKAKLAARMEAEGLLEGDLDEHGDYTEAWWARKLGVD